jgi:hypothetical protein
MSDNNSNNTSGLIAVAVVVALSHPVVRKKAASALRKLSLFLDPKPSFGPPPMWTEGKDEETTEEDTEQPKKGNKVSLKDFQK